MLRHVARYLATNYQPTRRNIPEERTPQKLKVLKELEPFKA
jgi:hypothetical protein